MNLAALKGEELAVGAVVGNLNGDGEGGLDAAVDGLQFDEVFSLGDAEDGEQARDEELAHG